ncbi:MAG: hypothetical protein M0Z54_12820 [Thermaerobacter sp.]|nr:hypothetical protein [Thermaerobacter sp.]
MPVDRDHHLQLNDGEADRITVLPRPPGDDPTRARDVESFWVFFATGALARARWAAHANLDSCLDAPDGRASARTLLNHPRRHDRVVSPMLSALHHQYAALRHDPLGLDESLARLMNAIVRGHDDTERMMAQLGAARPATRDELLRRVMIVRDYSDAHYAEPVPLVQVVRKGALSPDRVIQAYRQAFGTTPHRAVRHETRRGVSTAAARPPVGHRGGAGGGLGYAGCLQHGVQGRVRTVPAPGTAQAIR